MPSPRLASRSSLQCRLSNLSRSRAHRAFSTAAPRNSAKSGDGPTAAYGNGELPNPKWLSELRKRAEKVSQKETGQKSSEQLSKILKRLENDWLDLLAGREGYLTEPRWRGLTKHQIVWGDMDSMGHVNNVVYNRFAESARVNWTRGFAEHASPEHRRDWVELMSPRGLGLILKSIKTDYKMPITYPDQVTVIHKLAVKPGMSSDSVILDAVIYSERHKRLAARFFEDIVVYDYKAAKRAPLQPMMVEELERAYDLQEEHRVKIDEEVSEMEEVVKELEAGQS